MNELFIRVIYQHLTPTVMQLESAILAIPPERIAMIVMSRQDKARHIWWMAAPFSRSTTNDLATRMSELQHMLHCGVNTNRDHRRCTMTPT